MTGVDGHADRADRGDRLLQLVFIPRRDHVSVAQIRGTDAILFETALFVLQNRPKNMGWKKERQFFKKPTYKRFNHQNQQSVNRPYQRNSTKWNKFVKVNRKAPNSTTKLETLLLNGGKSSSWNNPKLVPLDLSRIFPQMEQKSTKQQTLDKFEKKFHKFVVKFQKSYEQFLKYFHNDKSYQADAKQLYLSFIRVGILRIETAIRLHIIECWKKHTTKQDASNYITRCTCHYCTWGDKNKTSWRRRSADDAGAGQQTSNIISGRAIATDVKTIHSQPSDAAFQSSLSLNLLSPAPLTSFSN